MGNNSSAVTSTHKLCNQNASPISTVGDGATVKLQSKPAEIEESVVWQFIVLVTVGTIPDVGRGNCLLK